MTAGATAGEVPRGGAGATTSLLLLTAVAGALLAAPLVVLRDEAPPAALLLAVPLLVALGLLGVHRPLWAVAALPATAVVGLRSAGGGGVQVVQVLAAAVTACVLVRLVASRRPLPRSGPLLWAFALLLTALASTAVAERVVLALKVDAGLGLGVAAAFCVVATCRRERDLRVLLRAASAGSLLVTVPVLSQLGDLQGLYGGANVVGRPVGVFAQPNDLGSYAVTSLWMALALVALARDRRDRLLGGLAAVAAAAATLFSLSRGSWFGAGVGALVLVVLHPRVLRALLVVVLAGAACVLGAVVVAPASAPAAVVLERVSTLSTGAANPDDRRDLVRQEAMRLLSTAPLLGHGPGSFAVEAAGGTSLISQYRRTHAHNVVLHVGAETGLVGITALLGLTAATATAAVRGARSRQRAGRPGGALAVACLAAGCASFAAHGLVDVTFLNPLIMVVTWTLLGALLAAASALGDEGAASARGVAAPSDAAAAAGR